MSRVFNDVVDRVTMRAAIKMVAHRPPWWRRFLAFESSEHDRYESSEEVIEVLRKQWRHRAKRKETPVS